MAIKTTLAALLLSAAVPAMALAQNQSSQAGSSNSSGTQFLQHVARDSVNEIHEALIAEAKAQDPAVLAYARLMADDHVILTSQLHAVASGSGFNLSDVDQSQGGANYLQGKSGAQFDRAFIDHEVSQHRQSVQRWQQEANSGGNSSAVSFAKLGLPLQREHLALAEAIQASLGHQAANR